MSSTRSSLLTMWTNPMTATVAKRPTKSLRESRKIISEDAFTFSVGQLMSIHGTLFEGLLKHPGQPRDYNFTKEIGVSVRTVKNVLKSLTESGKIKRKNGKRFGYWEVKEG